MGYNPSINSQIYLSVLGCANLYNNCLIRVMVLLRGGMVINASGTCAFHTIHRYLYKCQIHFYLFASLNAATTTAGHQSP